MSDIDLNKTARCQSCGMPISSEFGNLGTAADGLTQEEYCNICFQRGKFANPEQTMAQMIESSITNMTNEVGMSQTQAEQLANDFIPRLRRWRS